MCGKSLITAESEDYVKALASKMTSLIKEHSMSNPPTLVQGASIPQPTSALPPWWCLKAPNIAQQQDARYLSNHHLQGQRAKANSFGYQMTQSVGQFKPTFEVGG